MAFCHAILAPDGTAKRRGRSYVELHMRIVYFDIDTLRPDHLGCYGYARATSPNIDRLAAGGARFVNCHCSDAPCLPSRTALMTGRFGIHTGVVGHGGTAADMRVEGPSREFRDKLASQSLPAVLKRAGLHTVTISPFAERHSAWHFYAGFKEMHNTGRGGMESAEEITPTVLDWVSRNARKNNWFLHVRRPAAAGVVQRGADKSAPHAGGTARPVGGQHVQRRR
jgi:choline-sulfatase